jgi:hypothetical protein
MPRPNEPPLENLRLVGPEMTLRLTEFSLTAHKLWIAEHQLHKWANRINRLRLRANIYKLHHMAYCRKRAVILHRGVRLLNSLGQSAQVTDQFMAMARRLFIEYDRADKNTNRCARANTRALERERVILRQNDRWIRRVTVLRVSCDLICLCYAITKYS